MHLLIPYIPQRNHIDPDFSEFTYGDSDARARKLKKDLKTGNYVFFHSTISGKKHITAYYVVDRVLDTVVACQDKAITTKYRNPHIKECLNGSRPLAGCDDAVVFGDPIRSYTLEKPLLFDKKLADRLSLKIEFSPWRSESQVIGSATRAWRQLTDTDVEVILGAINLVRESSYPKLHRSTEEVAQTIEKDVEEHIAYSPNMVGKGMKLVGRQVNVPSGRIDLLLEDEKGNTTVVEVKQGRIGHDALRQIQRYIHDLRQGNEKVFGIIVCSGVLPAYEEELRKQKDIRVMIYGWNLSIRQW
jgi:hypothetical protein